VLRSQIPDSIILWITMGATEQRFIVEFLRYCGTVIRWEIREMAKSRHMYFRTIWNNPSDAEFLPQMQAVETTISQFQAAWCTTLHGMISVRLSGRPRQNRVLCVVILPEIRASHTELLQTFQSIWRNCVRTFCVVSNLLLPTRRYKLAYDKY